MRIASSLFCVVLLALAACRPSASVDAKPDRVARSAEPENHAANAGKAAAQPGTDPGHAGNGTPLSPSGKNQLAAFAAGCFWGVEATFRAVPGVVATAVGYSGGHTKSPTYETVCSHTTGHAETVLVEYDPTHVPYEQLLQVFWRSHDPTTLNRQGPDVGDQYRSAVFTFSREQEEAAKASRDAEQTRRPRKVVTEITAIPAFYKAEDYHQQYHEKTGTEACPTPFSGANQ
jgi:peptide-methionine (S)-S-oxide reductase